MQTNKVTLDSVAQKQAQYFEQFQSLKGSESILLFEDEQAIKEFIEEFLAKLGYNILNIPYVKDHDLFGKDQCSKPDLLLTDLALPGLNGIQLAKKLQDRWPDLKVLLMSGHSIDDYDTTPIGSDFTFIAKPFSIRELVMKIREMLDH